MNTYDHNPYWKIDLSNVGQGYRNVCWIPPSNYGGRTGTGKIVLLGYDKSGEPARFEFPFCPSVKYEVMHRTDEKDLYEKYIATKYFDDTNDRRAWCDAMDARVKIISCYPPEQEFLLNIFHRSMYVKNEKDETVVNPDFNKQPIRIHFIDIEVAVENEFPEPDEAKYPINLITIYDSLQKKFVSWALSLEVKNTIDNMPIELRKFKTEEDLLNDYMTWHCANYPDYITGWNVRGFDMLYIVKRFENLFGKQFARQYSPVRKYSIREDKKNYGKKYAAVKGISNLDLLFLYRDKFGIKQALDGGYSLDNVSNEELEDAKLKVYDVKIKDIKWSCDNGNDIENLPTACNDTIKCYFEAEVEGCIRKLLEEKYGTPQGATLIDFDYVETQQDASMLSFYKSHFQEFWEYNIQDVNLVVKLEEKLKLLSIARKITTFGCSPTESIYTTIAYIISSLDIYARTQFKRTFVSYSSASTRGKDVDQYEGAFVFPTQTGIYKQGVGTIDVNSLYPSTSRALNLSPETLVGELIEDAFAEDIKNNEKQYTIKFVNGRREKISESQLNTILNETCILSRNNMLFLKHEKKRGIFSEWCGFYFKLRKTYKKALAAGEANELKLKEQHASSEEIEKQQIENENNHATQYALKIMINSAYGTLGTTFSPIYDVRLAEAITKGGKFCNMSTSTFLNKYFKEHYGTDDHFNITISGDTDSVVGESEIDVIFDESCA